ncbi:MAG TPA: sigma-54 dependent transcriptional regulator [Thermodesulfobacteriota bacterium]|nr:sigma-54 dependent transcriptional regulator [Thermodesulfobacteriota bacterium]
MITSAILVVDDDPNAQFTIAQMLRDEGYDIFTAGNGRDALEIFKKNSIRLVISDIRMPGLSGIDLLKELKNIDPRIAVILLTGFGSVTMAVEALKQGAYYFFEKPIINNSKFLAIINQALKTQQLEEEVVGLRKEVEEKYSFPNIIGQHPKMVSIFDFIAKISKTDKTVLIQGESGTGKDLIAKTIHYNSPRRNKPLVTVNCGALTESLLSSELFGHSRGAFTGAIKDTIGRFQAAEGGTLILEEIGEVPLPSQKVYLKVIEEKVLEPVGSNQTRKVDVRIIVTTNRMLQEEVAKGTFRKDLFYRLSILSLVIPPLRDRISDLPLLIDYFFKKFQEREARLEIEPEVLRFLKTYSWPGNIRELSNVIQHMMTFCKGDRITMSDLPPSVFLEENGERGMAEGEIDLARMVSDLEKKWIMKKLEESDWNKEKTSQLLGITRRMLIDRLKKYDITGPVRLRKN